MPRTRKPAGQHQAEGTYRADRHAEPAIDLPVALEAIKPSTLVPASVAPEWIEVTRRLVGIGILIDVLRTATIRATEKMVVLKITKELFFRMVTDFPSIGIEVMRVLAQRIEHMNTQLREAVAARK